MEKNLETATFGGGCFWCVEAIFEQLKGVERTVSGYAGGEVINPTYHQVCAGTTGHAEVVQINFDPEVISFRELVEIFLTTHDPTTLNRQGADVGPQYRSIILYQDDEQRRIAHEVIAEIEKTGAWSKPIVTEVVPLTSFYPAEKYHQDYYRDNPSQPYCFIVIEPKLAKFREKYFGKLKEGMEMEG